MKKIILFNLLILLVIGTYSLYGNQQTDEHNVDQESDPSASLNPFRGPRGHRGPPGPPGTTGPAGPIGPRGPTGTVAANFASSYSSSNNQDITFNPTPIVFTQDQFNPVGITHIPNMWSAFTVENPGTYAINWAFSFQPTTFGPATGTLKGFVEAGLQVTPFDGAKTNVSPFPQSFETVVTFAGTNQQIYFPSQTLSGSMVLHLNALDSVELIMMTNTNLSPFVLSTLNPLFTIVQIGP